MSNTLWLNLVAGFLILHGIGHVGGSWFFNRSWLSPELAHGAWKWLFTAVWFAAMIGFIAAGIGVLQHLAWWRTAAIAMSVVSLVVSALYIQGPPFNAAAADVVILIAMLVAHWPSAELIGS
jgi:hypothetical protein